MPRGQRPPKALDSVPLGHSTGLPTAVFSGEGRPVPVTGHRAEELFGLFEDKAETHVDVLLHGTSVAGTSDVTRHLDLHVATPPPP